MVWKDILRQSAEIRKYRLALQCYSITLTFENTSLAFSLTSKIPEADIYNTGSSHLQYQKLTSTIPEASNYITGSLRLQEVNVNNYNQRHNDESGCY